MDIKNIDFQVPKLDFLICYLNEMNKKPDFQVLKLDFIFRYLNEMNKKI